MGIGTFSSYIVVYYIAKLFVTPFEKWDAYKLGIIDKNGHKIRNPDTASERDAWTLLHRFIANLKIQLEKIIGKNRILSYFSIAYLLKDSSQIIINNNDALLKECLQLKEDLKLSDIGVVKDAMEVLATELPIKDKKLDITIKFKEDFYKYLLMELSIKIKELENKIENGSITDDKIQKIINFFNLINNNKDVIEEDGGSATGVAAFATPLGAKFKKKKTKVLRRS